jgi:biopolymer transport protein ExbD
VIVEDPGAHVVGKVKMTLSDKGYVANLWEPGTIYVYRVDKSVPEEYGGINAKAGEIYEMGTDKKQKKIGTFDLNKSNEEIAEQFGLKLELEKSQGTVEAEKKDYILTVNKDAKIFLNEKEVLLNNLESEIKAAVPGMKGSSLIIKVDKNISYEIVVKVMDIVKKSGIESIKVMPNKK